ncbi:hypothetical protein GGR56DRAFT_317110 [Xylariaceae sp. FL0804]|nr:hypothetical protein GGR56DRAFT_317110 [Xylariaceae sp. FL0804]
MARLYPFPPFSSACPQGFSPGFTLGTAMAPAPAPAPAPAQGPSSSQAFTPPRPRGGRRRRRNRHRSGGQKSQQKKHQEAQTQHNEQVRSRLDQIGHLLEDLVGEMREARRQPDPELPDAAMDNTATASRPVSMPPSYISDYFTRRLQTPDSAPFYQPPTCRSLEDKFTAEDNASRESRTEPSTPSWSLDTEALGASDFSGFSHATQTESRPPLESPRPVEASTSGQRRRVYQFEADGFDFLMSQLDHMLARLYRLSEAAHTAPLDNLSHEVFDIADYLHTALIDAPLYQPRKTEVDRGREEEEALRLAQEEFTDTYDTSRGGVAGAAPLERTRPRNRGPEVSEVGFSTQEKDDDDLVANGPATQCSCGGQAFRRRHMVAAEPSLAARGSSRGPGRRRTAVRTTSDQGGASGSGSGGDGSWQQTQVSHGNTSKGISGSGSSSWERVPRKSFWA